MNLIKFVDSCVITRDGGSIKVDEYDNPINIEKIYEGKCRYQEKAKTSGGFSVRTCLVFIPGFIDIKENDIIEIENEMIHKRGIADTVRFIDFPLTGERNMRIELDQVKDVTEEDDEPPLGDGDQDDEDVDYGG